MGSAQAILEKHAKRIADRQGDLKTRVQAFFARNPQIKVWAYDLKEVFGSGVRVSRFKDSVDDSRS